VLEAITPPDFTEYRNRSAYRVPFLLGTRKAAVSNLRLVIDYLDHDFPWYLGLFNANFGLNQAMTTSIDII
jgi:hypothetical protein